jgi:hypothetical protein
MDMTVYRPSTGDQLTRVTGSPYTVQVGQAGDIPMPGHYDDDTKDDIVVRRPSDATWRSLSVKLAGAPP